MTVRDKMIDLYGVDDVQIEVRGDNKTIWINIDGKCVLRIQGINKSVKFEHAGQTLIFTQ